jgi:hypothetical protein
MKYLLKWMNNCEKELSSSCEPLYNYVTWLQEADKFMSMCINQFDTENLPAASKDGFKDLLQIVEGNVEEYMRTYLPPALLTLATPPNGPDILNSSTSLKDSLEILHILIANVVAFPHTLHEIIEETISAIRISTEIHADSNTTEQGIQVVLKSVIQPAISDMFKQSIKEAPMAITNTRWALKALMTYFFLKHSHKIQLTEVVQKMFEMTDISDNIDISKNLKLPYPMNYIEFNEAIPMELDHAKLSITGALMYEIETHEHDRAGAVKPVFHARISDFPKKGYVTRGKMCGLIGIDQVRQTVKDGCTNMRLQFDKALIINNISDHNNGEVLGGIGTNLRDSANTWAMGIPIEDLNQEERPSMASLVTENWEDILTLGYGKLAFEYANSMDDISALALNAAGHVRNMVIDPLYKYDEEAMEPNIKDEKYTVVELIINYDKYDDTHDALWTNVGPYIEIGRREGGDTWDTVKSNFTETISGVDESSKAKVIEAFKIALQSIWFINEPDVKLKPVSEVQPSKGRQYFPKRKITKMNKIVLRGEISRYLTSLRKSTRGSPKGAWWVRGHWRNQWYPSLQDNKRKWIRPYVKGTGKATKKQVDLDPNTEV